VKSLIKRIRKGVNVTFFENTEKVFEENPSISCIFLQRKYKELGKKDIFNSKVLAPTVTEVKGISMFVGKRSLGRPGFRCEDNT
jgi:hypothetical protein